MQSFCVDCGKDKGNIRPSRAAANPRCKSCAQEVAKTQLWGRKPRSAVQVLVDDKHKDAVSRVRWHRTKRHASGRVLGIGRIYLHRYVWLLEYRSLPEREIDHINGDGLDNRIANLRLATGSLNATNRDCKGVSFVGGILPWRAAIRRYLSQTTRRFLTQEEALEWRRNAKEVCMEFEQLMSIDSDGRNVLKPMSA